MKVHFASSESVYKNWDKSIFKGIVPIVIDRKRLSHPNQPSHINGGDNVGVFNGSGERDSGSPKTVFLVF